MPNSPKTQITTKKHLARVERERRQRRYILLGSALVIVLVLGLIGYGILDQTVLRALQPVAIVNGEKIASSQFEAQVRYGRYSLIRNAMNTYQFMQIFGSDPNTQASFVQQLQQIQSQLVPTTVGQQVLDQLVDDALVRQQAKTLGITISDDEVNKAFEAAFGYYPNGTPTPSPTYETQPTSTLSPLQETLSAQPTATSTPTVVVTQTATPTPDYTPTPEISPTPVITASPEITLTQTAPLTPTVTPIPTSTPTPYTLEGYQKLYKDTINSFQKDYSISESDLRFVIESQLYQEKVLEFVVGDPPHEQEMVWARHILVADEQTANEVLGKLNQGEDWCSLASQYSTDTSNKDQCGDLSWFPRGQMDTAFENAAFALGIGQTSQPIQSQFGWHIIQALGHENRPLSDSDYQQLKSQKFQDWLTGIRDSADIVKEDYWQERVPVEPTLPAEIEQLLQQNAQTPQSLPVQPSQP